MKHLDSREDFETSEEFANFRGLILNNRESKLYFRSASAIRDKYGRAKTVQKLMGQLSI